MSGSKKVKCILKRYHSFYIECLISCGMSGDWKLETRTHLSTNGCLFVILTFSERNQQTDQLANKIDNHMLLVDQKQALYEGQKQKIRLWKIGPIGFGTPNA